MTDPESSQPPIDPALLDPETLAPEDAVQILRNLNISLPEPKGEFDRQVGAHVLWAMGSIPRAGMYDEGEQKGMPQTNFDHIGHGVLLGLFILETSGRTDLDHGEAIRQFLVHELGEGFGQDTPHHDPKLNATKHLRDPAGHVLAKHFLHTTAPGLVEPSDEYHERMSRAANFGKALDTLEKTHFAIRTHAYTQQYYSDDFYEFGKRILRETMIDPTIYPWAKYLLNEIAQKWEDDWGCVPYNGDPKTIVSVLEQEVRDEIIREEVAFEDAREYGIRLPEWQQPPDEADDLDLEDLDDTEAFEDEHDA